MNNLYDVLEVCLQDIEQGADVETILFRYPDLAEELRPILEASAGAKAMAVPAPSAEIVRRNRAKVLQHAAHMRESKAKSSQRVWFASLRRIAVSLAVVILLFVSGTGLVGASSNTLPGDNLYPVKRTWEGLRLFFAFDPQVRDALELEHENERLHELRELLAEGRTGEVDFNGVVEAQNGNEWVVAGVRVLITDQTEVRDVIGVGTPVRVRGITQGNDAILAERIRLLSSKDKLPDVDDDHDENSNGDHSGPGSGDDEPNVEETEMPELENDNSGNGNDSNENDNSNDNEDSNTNDNSGSRDDSNVNEDAVNDSHNDTLNDNSGSDDNSGGNDNGNNGGGDSSKDNDNGDDSGGGGDNSGSGGGDDGSGGGGGD